MKTAFERFKEWAISKGYPVEQIHAGGEFCDAATQTAWDGWTACMDDAAALPVQGAQPPSTTGGDAGEETSDTKRMDWLEEQQDVTWQTDQGQWHSGPGSMVRELIDAAMKRAAQEANHG